MGYTVFADGTISKDHTYLPLRINHNTKTGDRVLVRLDKVGGTVTDHLWVVTAIWHDAEALNAKIAEFDETA